MGQGEVKIEPARGFVLVSPLGKFNPARVCHTEWTCWRTITKMSGQYRSELEAEGWRVLPCTITVEEAT